MDEKDLEKIEGVFKRHIGILSEDFQPKLDIVAEGHQMLSEKLDSVESQLSHRIDGVEQRIDELDVKLSNKIDAVAADLAAHRADTEIHKTRYQISEDTDS
jgi:vacuolar-type H+-ATPase subunit I/STV1